MADSILTTILNCLTWLVNLVLSPINSLFNNLFPDMTSYISQFNSFITNYVGGSLSYFFSLLPPITKNIILLYVSFLILYYPIVWTYTLSIRLFAIIQKIKFW